MVRVNIIAPEKLADQHLIAEYNEILMLIAYIKKHPNPRDIPQRYCLGKGHMRFFKNKILYLKKRHESLKKEMRKRGFAQRKSIRLDEFPEGLKNDWQPDEKDKKIIKKRITKKLSIKPDYYRYYGKQERPEFFIGLINKN